jgi:hypothetical protein
MSQSLSLSTIFNVAVVVSPAAVAPPSFNQGLIVGPSAVIPSQGASGRVQLFTSLAAMATAGFSASNPEYLAAELYFGQSPAPVLLWVGRQDLSALASVAVGSAAGTGYAVGDILAVSQAGGSNGQVRVSTIGAGGAVTAVAIIAGAQGTGYTVASGVTTTGGTGTGFDVNIVTLGETPLQAVTACRNATPSWYAATFVGTAIDSDHEAIAAFIEGASPQSTYFITTSEAAVLTGATPNLLSVLQAASYRRTFSVYSTTQSGAFPNNAYAAAAVVGIAMGRNTGTPGSYFDVMFKSVASVGAEPLTQSQVNAISGVPGVSNGLNGNVVVSYNNGSYSWLQPGVMASGVFFDEVLNLDMLAAAIQVNIANLFISSSAVPITEAGETMCKSVVAQACTAAQQIGFVAPSGTWSGNTIGTGTGAISNGQALTQGFAIYSAPVATLSIGQRAARVMQPITVALIESGSGHSLSISVDVQR